MQNRLQSFSLLVLLSVVWGSSFILIKKGLEGFSPMQVGSLRILIAGLTLLPVALYNIRRTPRKDIYYSVMFGLCNAGVPAFLFAIAQTQVNSSTAGILNALTPLFTLLVGASFFRTPFNKHNLLGVVIGFLGACMLIFFRDGFGQPLLPGDTRLTFALLIVVATVMYGFSGNIMAKQLNHVPGAVISAYAYNSFAIPCAIYLLFSDFGYRLAENPEAWASLGYLALLGIFGSALAIVLYSRLVKQSNAMFASFVTYFIPFMAILWGAIAGEYIGIVPFVSLAVILSGIYISGRRSQKTLQH